MEKTKRQLRAEAVERLKNDAGARFSPDAIVCALLDGRRGKIDWSLECDAILDLLEDDDMDSAVCVQKCQNDEPQKRDAAALLRDWLDYKINRFDAEANAIFLNTGADPDKLYEIADMIERDYVSHEAYEDLRDEFTWTNSFLHRVGKQCGTKDVPSLKAYVEQLEAKVAEYEAVDRRIAETDARWEAAIRDLESMTAERDEWKAKAEQAQESYLDAKADRDAWHARYEDANDDPAPNRDGVTDKLTIAWLDRQAAIDERYWKSQVDALVSKGETLADGNTWLWSEAAELQEKVDEQRKSLEAAWEDNAELTDQLESAHAKNRALKAHISKMQEGRHGWHIKAAKLQSQVDKLTAECGECVYKQEFASIDELQEKVDSLTQANGDLRDEWHRVCRERDELQRKLHESNRERERLRKSLGIALDHAHDMIALTSVDTDEGLA